MNKTVDQLIPGDRICTQQYKICVFLGFQDDYVNLRYQATCSLDPKEIWVNIIERKDKVTYDGPPDEKSLAVLTLTGVYGEFEETDSTKLNKKIKP